MTQWARGEAAVRGREVAGWHPPYLYPNLVSTRLRALSDTNSAAYGRGGVGKPDLARQHRGALLVERIVVTGRVPRIHFSNEGEANARDSVPPSIEDPTLRNALFARDEGDASRFDVRFRGEDQTAFLGWPGNFTGRSSSPSGFGTPSRGGRGWRRCSARRPRWRSRWPESA